MKLHIEKSFDMKWNDDCHLLYCIISKKYQKRVLSHNFMRAITSRIPAHVFKNTLYGYVLSVHKYFITFYQIIENANFVYSDRVKPFWILPLRVQYPWAHNYNDSTTSKWRIVVSTCILALPMGPREIIRFIQFARQSEEIG